MAVEGPRGGGNRRGTGRRGCLGRRMLLETPKMGEVSLDHFVEGGLEWGMGQVGEEGGEEEWEDKGGKRDIRHMIRKVANDIDGMMGEWVREVWASGLPLFLIVCRVSSMIELMKV